MSAFPESPGLRSEDMSADSLIGGDRSEVAADFVLGTSPDELNPGPTPEQGIRTGLLQIIQLTGDASSIPHLVLRSANFDRGNE